MRGLNTKTVEFRNNVLICDYIDVFMLSETWATDSLMNSELFAEDYCVYRCDRVTGRGGGVLVAVRSSISCTAIVIDADEILNEYKIDVVGLRIFLHSIFVNFIVVYIPPSTPAFVYDHLFHRLELLDLFDGEFVFVGDFNVPNFDSAHSPQCNSINNFVNSTNAIQINNVKNQQNNCLDLVFCSVNTSYTVDRCDFTLVAEDAYHPALTFDLVYNVSAFKRFAASPASTYNFRKANFLLLYDLILRANWDSVILCDDVDHACDNFYTILYECFDSAVPLGRRRSGSHPPWFSSETKVLIKTKRHYLKLYKTTRLQGHLNRFKECRRLVRSGVKRDYSDYIAYVEDDIKNNPRKLWSFVGSLKGQTRIPGTMMRDNTPIDSPWEITNAFASHFESVFQDRAANEATVGDDLCDSSDVLVLSRFEEKDVLAAIGSLKDTLTMGPDMVPAFILRDCRYVLVEPLHHVINLILRHGKCPDSWKISRVTPVLKSGDKSKIINYRPISLICSFAKVFELAMHGPIYHHILNQISTAQHGFVKGRSTVTNLCSFTHLVSEALDNRHQVDVVYTDFSKAFDLVPHDLIINKMGSFGLAPSLVRVFESYLSNRRSYVEYRGYKSNEYYTMTGVPQGSVLGPLLFIMFINDVVQHVSSKHLLYADDLKLFRVVESSDDCNALQSDIDALCRWSGENGLQLNISKCRVLSFTRKRDRIVYTYKIDDEPLERCRVLRDLGVIFDEGLTFSDQVENMCARAYRTLGFLTRNTKQLRNDTFQTLYDSSVRSILEYCAVIWNPSYIKYVNLVENVQRKFLKTLYFRKHTAFLQHGYSYEALLEEFSYMSLSDRRIVAEILFVSKLVGGHICDPGLLALLNFLVPRQNSRSTFTFYLPSTSTRHHAQSPVVSMCRAVNEHCSGIDIFFSTIVSLKSQMLNKFQ